MELKKLMNIELKSPDELDAGFDNWTGIEAAFVIRRPEAYLVVHHISGQDNVYREGRAYSEPPEWRWANHWFAGVDEKPELEVTYQFPRELGADIKISTREYSVYEVFTGSIGGIEKADVFIEGVPVPKVIMPEIPDVFGIIGLNFYTNFKKPGVQA